MYSTLWTRISPIIAHQSKIKIKVVTLNLERLYNLNYTHRALLKAISRSNLGRASLEQNFTASSVPARHWQSTAQQSFGLALKQ